MKSIIRRRRKSLQPIGTEVRPDPGGRACGGAGFQAWKWAKDRRRLRQLAQSPEPAYDIQETPKVSILLPAWNEAGSLASCIESILSLRYPEKELVVCAGGRDATLEIARRFEPRGVIVLEQAPGEGKQGALRRSFERSGGEIIFLTDADCILDDETFERTLSAGGGGREVAAGGAWRPFDRQLDHPFVLYQWSHHLYREIWMPEYTPSLDGRNAAIRRRCWIWQALSG